MNPVAEDILMHYGVKRRSGRYPWGSGKEPYQHSGDFLSRVEDLQKQGITYTDENGKVYTGENAIAKTLGMTTTDYRMQIRVAKHERRALEADRAKSLRSDGKSLNEIAQIMGYKNDSSVRSLLNENTAINKNRAQVTSDILKKELETKEMLDVGAGVHLELGCSEGTLKEALFILQTQGYEVYGVGIKQPTNPGKQTNTAVLCKPGTEYKTVYEKMGDIQSVGNYHSVDGGTTYNQLRYPASIDSNRVHILYGDQGGINKDGVIEIRRGVADLDLGNSHYAQVRILVDGTHYLKGMAMYSDDMPEGADIIFNTNKPSGTPKEKVFKAIKNDPENPFGAAIKAGGQSTYLDANGKEQLSAINKLKEEGDWDKMARNLSSQFLSKQPKHLIKQQLDRTYADHEAEYDEICSLTNPTLKKKLLMDFADSCDSAATHLQAAAFPRQSMQVILPSTHLKDTEVYAPNYKNGEQVALVRYPHGGTFEIPVLTVNNRNPNAKAVFGNMTDAVAIHPKVAERLSGADFDGDTVAVIPMSDRVNIKSTPALKELEGFDPKTEYAIPDGNPNNVRVMTKANTQKQMGVVSNLITDMTLKGAPPSDIARAVKHSMVVIDAEKHKLDYKQSEKDQGIAELKARYQGYISEDGKYVSGASTLLSRRKQNIQVDERRGSGRIDEETGKMVYKTSGREYVDKNGNVVKATTKAKLLLETDDLHKLSSGTVPEELYADYGNKMKALANQARKEYLATKETAYSAEAKKEYSIEVEELDAYLRLAQMNAPKERRALALANSRIKAKMQSNPELSKDKKELGKIRNAETVKARIEVGADGKGSKIHITPRQWEAIQKGAISPSKLGKILKYADGDEVKGYAMPKTTTELSPARISKLESMVRSGAYTNQEIASALGCSVSTVSKYSRAA